ncbi:MAG: hypothetical protein H6P98_584, partial [Candidatus Aminicenantes bacterium]|nr:hypothetical protein [Candidatus Aminicenantes bacterium]
MLACDSERFLREDKSFIRTSQPRETQRLVDQGNGNAVRSSQFPANTLLFLVQGHGPIGIPKRFVDQRLITERSLQASLVPQSPTDVLDLLLDRERPTEFSLFLNNKGSAGKRNTEGILVSQFPENSFFLLAERHGTLQISTRPKNHRLAPEGLR